MSSGQFLPRNLKDLSEKYDIIQDQYNRVENTKNSQLETMQTSHNPIYFNYYGARLKLETREDPKKKANILLKTHKSSVLQPGLMSKKIKLLFNFSISL